MKRISIVIGLLIAALGTVPARAQVIIINSCGTVPSSITTLVQGKQSLMFMDTTGVLCTSGSGGGGGGGTSSAFNAAFPANGTAIGMANGAGNMVPFLAADALSSGDSGSATVAVAPWWWNGTSFDPTSPIGLIGDSAWVSGNGSVIALLKNVATGVASSIPAGTNVIGDIRNITGTFTTIPTFKIDQTTPGTTNGVQVNAALPAGSNVIGQTSINQTTFGTTNGVVNAANTYNTVAASQTAQVLGATGAAGDYLSHCVATPGTTSPGVVTILDNATAIVSFAGGASSVSNLVPFPIPIGAKSTSGAWKITTGANITVVCVGHFT